MNKIIFLVLLITFTLLPTACDNAHFGSKHTYTVTGFAFISSNTASVYENQLSAITLVAVDNSSTYITYSISEGDSADFDLNSTSGVVTFKIAPDFETKQNYSFIATAINDSDDNITQSVTIIILDEEIQHNGTDYESVISPYTGERWLDRNLGASQVCTAVNDASCFGDYYQWGRNADGHEKATSSTTSVLATNVNSAGISFIKVNSNLNGDWLNNIDSDGAIRASNWSKTDGTSVCPIGYRVPTITELLDETTAVDTDVTNITPAFTNFLKIPSAGYRNASDGVVSAQGFHGSIWSSSVNVYSTKYLYFYLVIENGVGSRTYGRSVRCIKD